MKKHLFRLLTLLCVFAFIVTAVPVTVSAEELTAAFTNIDSNISTEADSGKTFEEAAIIGEITEMREENVKYFRRDDGMIVAAMYDKAVHYQDGDEWKEIDNTLVAEETRDGVTYYKNTANKLQVRMPDQLNTNTPITVQNGEYTLQWTLQSGQSKSTQITPVHTSQKKTTTLTTTSSNTAVVKNQKKLNEQKMTVEKLGSSVVYDRVYDNVLFHYDVVGDKFKESIVLAKPTNQTEFSFLIQAQGLTAQLQEDGSVRFFAPKTEEPIFVIASPYMFDSNHEYSQDVTVQLTSVKGGYQYVLTPSQTWLQAEERQYPITIDPTVQTKLTQESIEAAQVYSRYPTNLYGGVYIMYAGAMYKNPNLYEYQSFVKLPMPELEDGTRYRVVSAKAYFTFAYDYDEEKKEWYTIQTPNNTQINLHPVTGEWTESTISWSNRPSFDTSTIIDYAIVNEPTDEAVYGSVEFDITPLAEKWVNNPAENHGFMLKGAVISSTAGNFCAYSENVTGQYEQCRPNAIISFRECNGLENYWTYTSMSVGRNTTVAVNNATGTMTAVIPGCGVDGNLLPVSISHIYNSSGEIGSTYGDKWRLNYQMSVKPVTLKEYTFNSSNSEVSENTKETYQFVDGDGTAHYFVLTDENEYKDEDGLGLTLTIDNGNANEKYTLTDQGKNTMVFNNYGNLKYIRDSNCDSNGNPAPNYIEIFYDTNSATQKISRIRDGAGRSYTFAYNNGELASITDPAGRKTNYTYNYGNLRRVTYPDGVYIDIDYLPFYISSISGFGQTIDILYDAASPRRVSSLTLSNGSPETVGDKYTFEYGHNYTDITTITDAKFTYQFNEYLQTVCVVSHADGSAQSYKYGKPGGTPTGEENQLLLASDVKQSAVNLLYNSRLEQELTSTSGHFFPSIATGISGSVTYDSTRGHTANGSIRVQRTAVSADPLQYIYAEQQIIVPETGYYALSAFVNTDGQMLLDGYGAVVRLERWLNYNEHLSSSQSTVNYTPEDEWHRAGTSLYCEEGNILKILVGTHGNETLGEMWFDDVQLEKFTETVNEFNLLTNAAFSDSMYWGNNLGNWSVVDSVPGETADETAFGRPEKAARLFRVYGVATADRYVYQTIQVADGKKGDAFSMGAWAMASSTILPEDGDRTFGVCVEFVNTDNTTTKRRISFNPAYTRWQFVSGEAIADKDYESVKFYLEYNHNVNTAYFALPFLYKDNYGHSYTYDQDGNVVSAKDQENSQTAYAYNNQQLGSLAAPTGTKQFVSSNDDTHNVESVLTTNGQRYEYQYDSYGNLTSTTVGIERFATSLSSGQSYYIRNAYSGNALDSAGLTAGDVFHNWRWINDNPMQIFTLVSTGEPDVYIVQSFEAPHLRMDVDNGDGSDGTSIKLWEDNQLIHQHFKITSNDNGTFTIYTGSSEYASCIDGQPGDATDASNATPISQQAYVEDDPGQQWYFIRCDEEITDDYYIQSSVTYNSTENYVATATDALGNITLYATNADNGNLYSFKKPNEISMHYEYDQYGIHNTKVTAQHGTDILASVSYTYNQKDQLTNITNTSTGQSYEFRYDSLNRPGAVFEGSSSNYLLASYTYNAQNLLSKLTYGNGSYVNYAYDDLGRQIKTWYGTNISTGYETVYNSRGLVGLLKDLAAGTSTRYGYDLAGRLTHMRQESTSLGYRITEAFYRFEDGTNRLLQDRIYVQTGQDLGDLFGSVTDYTYGDIAAGEMPDYVYSIAQNGTTELEYVYDSLGRLESRVLSVPNLNTNYYYTNSDEDYSTSTQIKLITTPTEDFLYNYDAVGNITQMYKDMALTESYTYDDLDQLKTATVNGKTYAYTYDSGGNILTATEDGTSHTYTYGNTAWKDQLTAYDGQTITYDAIGNPLTYRNNMSFTWQNGRQLASTTKNGVTTSYTYNGDGTRNTKTVDNTTTQYYYVNGRLQALTKDIYTAFFLYDDTGRPYSIRVTILPERHTYPMYVMAYYKYNLQGDVVGLYNTSGQEFVTYTYDPWGKPLSSTGISPLLIANPFRYRGYVYDEETGLYYCNSRYYDPETGRFISTDTTDVLTVSPMAVTDKNLYAYCDNNPIIRVDRGGQVWETVFDVISLGASIVDVCINPSDPWAWAGLAGDVVDLIPFVAGVGEVTRAIKTIDRVTDAVDTTHDIAKVGQKAPVVIGENMKRVKQYAKDIGGHAYRPWKNDPFDFDVAMTRNKRWINDMMNEGREIIDIGPDFARRRIGVLPSDFYNMERSQLKGYANYRKVFTRQGKYGGLLGEW